MPPTALSDADLAALAGPVTGIARAAGAAIMTIYREGFAVESKADETPVTDADHAAEAVILPELRALTPDIPAVSEEADAKGTGPESGLVTFWAVDPLDGTREFIRRSDEFSVNIGLVVDRRPVFGVVYGPAVDQMYWTAGPGTAMRRIGDGPGERIRARAAPPEGVTVIASRSHGSSRRIAELLEGVAVAARLQAGSALKFGRLAEGAADLYPRFGHTSEWDTAAGHAVLNAAGGSVRTLDGAELGYGKPGYLNPDFIAWGRG